MVDLFGYAYARFMFFNTYVSLIVWSFLCQGKNTCVVADVFLLSSGYFAVDVHGFAERILCRYGLLAA